MSFHGPAPAHSQHKSLGPSNTPSRQRMTDPMDASLNLIRRAQDGEQDALGNLFERCYSRVRAFVLRRLGPELRLEADSVDSMQETILGAVEAFGAICS